MELLLDELMTVRCNNQFCHGNPMTLLCYWRSGVITVVDCSVIDYLATLLVNVSAFSQQAMIYTGAVFQKQLIW